ncbi:hypothetical protein L9F63_015615, partial [Diploptera punctata]
MNPEENKSEHFQVCVTVLEARHLAWPTMNPMVCIEIDKQTKYTATKESTDCPFYNEYFVFDFYLPFSLFLEKSITLSVIHARGFGRRNKILGKVQFDVATAWKQPDQQFYHKWAVLLDSNDPSGSIKGYLKCDITVIGKGDVVKVHPPGREKDDNDIEGWKIHTSNPQKSTSPRLQAETWVVVLGDGASYRGRLLLAVETEPLETVNTLKGSHKRGVILRSVAPVDERQCWQLDEYLLVGVLWEISMLDQKYKNKQVHVEISLGSTGNMSQSHLQPPMDLDTLIDNTSEFEEPSSRNPNPKLWSITEPEQPELRDDKDYCCITFENAKPCVFVHSKLPDTRHRIYQSNLLARLLHKLSVSLTQAKLNEMDGKMEEHMESTLYHLISGCERYLSIISAHHRQTPNVNKLDRLRIRLCHNEVENIMNISKKLQENLTKNKTETTLIELQNITKKLNLLMEDPQHSLPDLFVWLIVDGKRIAFHRAAARHFMFSVIPEEKGMNCGHIQTILMKAPAKAGESNLGGTKLPAKIDIVLWLGRSKHAHTCFKSLPAGYETLDGFGPHHLCLEKYPTLPREIRYTEKHKFEFRAYIHQGRLKPGSDSTALCDAFVRVIITGWSKNTQIEKASLNPIWDQTLIVEEVILPGIPQTLKSQPPIIVMEVYDMDSSLLQSRTELVGRTTARPHMKLAEQTYYIPQLQWYQLHIGNKITGEILATFELLQVLSVDLKDMLQGSTAICLLFQMTRTFVSYINFRMEVLFWGLRDMKKMNMFTVKKPQVTAECHDQELHSTILANVNHNPNFTQPLQLLDLQLPKQAIYHPPLTFTINEQHSFGRSKYVGTHIQQSVAKFLVNLDTHEEHIAKLRSVVFPPPHNDFGVEENVFRNDSETTPLLETFTKKGTLGAVNFLLSGTLTFLLDEIEEDESFDWWAKYYASLQVMDKEPHEVLNELVTEHLRVSSRPSFPKQFQFHQEKYEIYPNELEAQAEFGNFNDFLQSFEIYHGKTTGDEMLDRGNIIGTLK